MPVFTDVKNVQYINSYIIKTFVVEQLCLSVIMMFTAKFVIIASICSSLLILNSNLILLWQPGIQDVGLFSKSSSAARRSYVPPESSLDHVIWPQDTVASSTADLWQICCVARAKVGKEGGVELVLLFCSIKK